MIVPAIIPRSLDDVFAQAKTVKPFSRVLHIDAVDGLGATAPQSWPYTPESKTQEPRDMRMLADMFEVEFDLMVGDALVELPRYLDARPKRVVVHIESCADVAAAKTEAAALGALLGLAASNDTPLELYLEELTHADYAQCMGIASVGAQGRPFDPRVLARIRTVHTHFPEMEIAIDGAVNSESITLLKDAGATRFVVGSAIIHAQNPESAYHELSQLVDTFALQKT